MDDGNSKTVFLEYSRTYADVNALGASWEKFFSEEMKNLRDVDKRRSFKTGFAQAVKGVAVTPREYEDARDILPRFQKPIRSQLRHLWDIFYPGEDPNE